MKAAPPTRAVGRGRAREECPTMAVQGCLRVMLCDLQSRGVAPCLTRAGAQENASPDVLADLEDFFHWVVPDGGGGRYRHEEEGPDDMPAHIRAALTQTQLCIPVEEGRPVLGTW